MLIVRSIVMETVKVTNLKLNLLEKDKPNNISKLENPLKLKSLTK